MTTEFVKIDSKPAQADLAKLAAALDKASASVTRMEKAFATGVANTSTALDRGMRKMEQFARVTALISKARIDGNAAAGLKEFASSIDALGRAKSFSDAKVKNLQAFIALLPTIKVPAGAAKLSAFLNAISVAKAPSNATLARLERLFQLLANYKGTAATRNASSLASFFATLSTLKVPSAAAISRLEQLFRVLAAAPRVPNAQQIIRDLDMIGQAAARLGNAFGTLPTKMNLFGPAAQKTAKNLDLLRGRFSLAYQAGTAFSAFFASFTFGQFIKSTFDASRDLSKLETALFFVTASVEGTKGALKDYTGIVNRLGLDLQSTIDPYSRFTLSATTAGLALDQSNKVFEAVGGALSAVGASSQQTELAFYGLTQMIQKGKVSSEEFNRQIGEQIPANAEIGRRALEKMFGRRVTMQEFFDEMKKGAIQSVPFVTAYAEELKAQFGPLLEAALKRPDKALIRLKNSFTTFLQGIGKGGFYNALGETLNRVTALFVGADGALTPFAANLANTLGQNLASMIRTAGDLVVWLTTNFDKLVMAVKALAAFKLGSMFLGFVTAAAPATKSALTFGLSLLGIGKGAKAARTGLMTAAIPAMKSFVTSLPTMALLAAAAALAVFGDKATTVGGQVVTFNDITMSAFDTIGAQIEDWWKNSGSKIDLFGLKFSGMGESMGEVTATMIAGFKTLVEIVFWFAKQIGVAIGGILAGPIQALLETFGKLMKGDIVGALGSAAFGTFAHIGENLQQGFAKGGKELDGILAGYDKTRAGIVSGAQDKAAVRAATGYNDGLISESIFEQMEPGMQATRAQQQANAAAMAAAGEEDDSLSGVGGAVDQSALLQRIRGAYDITKQAADAATVAASVAESAAKAALATGVDTGKDDPRKWSMLKDAAGPVATAKVKPGTVPQWFINSIIKQESGGRAGVLGPQTKYGVAKGLMQMLDPTAKRTAEKHGVAWRPGLMTGKDEGAAAYQKQLGTLHLQDLSAHYGGDLEKVALGYHGGTNQKIWGAKTRQYAVDVLGRGPEALAGGPGVDNSGGAAPKKMTAIQAMNAVKRYESLIGRSGPDSDQAEANMNKFLIDLEKLEALQQRILSQGGMAFIDPEEVNSALGELQRKLNDARDPIGHMNRLNEEAAKISLLRARGLRDEADWQERVNELVEQGYRIEDIAPKKGEFMSGLAKTRAADAEAATLNIGRQVSEMTATRGMSQAAVQYRSDFKGYLEELTGLSGMTLEELRAAAGPALEEVAKHAADVKYQLENPPGFQKWVEGLEPLKKRLEDIKTAFAEDLSSTLTDALVGEDVDWSAMFQRANKARTKAHVDELLKGAFSMFGGGGKPGETPGAGGGGIGGFFSNMLGGLFGGGTGTPGAPGAAAGPTQTINAGVVYLNAQSIVGGAGGAVGAGGIVAGAGASAGGGIGGAIVGGIGSLFGGGAGHANAGTMHGAPANALPGGASNSSKSGGFFSNLLNIGIGAALGGLFKKKEKNPLPPGKWPGGIIGTMGGVETNGTYVPGKQNPIAGLLNAVAGMAMNSFMPTGAGKFAEGGYATQPVSRVSSFASARSIPHYAEGTANTSGGMPAVLHPNEAVIPLSRGRRVPVEMNGGGATNVTSNITVIAPNPDAFRKSSGAIKRDQNRSLRRAAVRNAVAGGR